MGRPRNDLTNDPEQASDAVDEKKTVTVTEDFLKSMQERLSLLEGLAGKNAILGYQEAHRDHATKTAHLKMVNGQPVVEWRMVTNDVFKNEAGNWVEDQSIEVVLANAEKVTMRYTDFIRTQAMKLFTIIDRQFNSDGSPSKYTLKDDMGNTFDVPARVLNP